MSDFPQEIIGDCRLILGDCREVLPTLGRVDAVVTDPPYGLGARMKGGAWGAQEINSGFLRWDLEPPHDVVVGILALGVPTVLWGGNYFAVPPSRCWLSWSKSNAMPTMADFELAWTNFDRPSKAKVLPVGSTEHGHPTQKPLELMAWCLDFLPPGAGVLDPFMGSGTTGVACCGRGRQFIGIEREAEYFPIACRRIEAAYRQPRLFEEPRPPALQSGDLF